MEEVLGGVLLSRTHIKFQTVVEVLGKEEVTDPWAHFFREHDSETLSLSSMV